MDKYIKKYLKDNLKKFAYTHLDRYHSYWLEQAEILEEEGNVEESKKILDMLINVEENEDRIVKRY